MYTRPLVNFFFAEYVHMSARGERVYETNKMSTLVVESHRKPLVLDIEVLVRCHILPLIRPFRSQTASVWIASG